MQISDMFIKTPKLAVTVDANGGRNGGASEPPSAITSDDDPMNDGRVRPQGVGLKEGTIDVLDRVAKSWGMARNKLMVACIRYVLREIRAGRMSKNDLFDNITEIRYTIK
jgi:hypothetical protein